jgi:hypothetical protein
MPSSDYPILENPKSSIRLLKLVYSIELQTIECKIYRIPLFKCPPYTAVSYTWGLSPATRRIVINNKPVSILENAWHFLCQMRMHSRWRRRLYWIDSICISQEDFEERHAQVSIMRQIYSTAENVFVWLGISTPECDLALDYIAQIVDKSSLTNPSRSFSYRPMWTNEEGRAVLALCQRAYWTRVWIVQEIMNAKCIRVFCGSKSLAWENFGSVFQSLKSIELKGWFFRLSYGAEVLASPAAIIFWQKERWDKSLVLKENGAPLTTLLE